MHNTYSRALLLALSTLCLSALFACTANPTNGPTAKRDANATGTPRSDGGARPDREAPSGDAPRADNEGTTKSDGGTATSCSPFTDLDQCGQCCADQTPGIPALVAASKECEARCAEEDDACFGRCFEATDAACRANPAMCDAVKACFSTCPVPEEEAQPKQ